MLFDVVARKNADRPLPAVELSVPSAPFTANADALETVHAPPRGAVPQPEASVRVKRSSAILFEVGGSVTVSVFAVLLMSPWSSRTVSVIV